MSYILELDAVSKQYQTKLALDKVSLSIPRGSVYGLLGPNGAGKTTMLRIINHITGPDSGTVRFEGRNSTAEDAYRMGYMPEERGLYKKMTVWDQLIFFARLKGVTAVDARLRAKEWLKRLELLAWAGKKVEELSKGMAQKVQFIATVIHKPDLLILDEPFSGFDPVNADLMKQEILELQKQGVTILFSTHRMESVEEMCSHICLINQSKVLLDGSISDIRKRYKNREYELVTARPYEQNIPSVHAGEARVDAHGEFYCRVQLEPGANPNALIQDVIDNNQLIMFREWTPSVHEIFVMHVKGVEA
ncbi:MAG: ATP-binding cassette domain-containing protein [Bacteroidetes bacterium]|nr:ATP-binding cassette domain-containing protein [Bacteroidota bacterium]